MRSELPEISFSGVPNLGVEKHRSGWNHEAANIVDSEATSMQKTW
jgi:hypothetical protein